MVEVATHGLSGRGIECQRIEMNLTVDPNLLEGKNDLPFIAILKSDKFLL